MNRINELFKQKKNNILSVYFTAGFPQLNDTCTVIEELAKQGIDMIEVGIPFSDPMADGSVIQQSTQTALQNGMTLNKLFEQLEHIREKVSIPLILMGYLNPIMQYGFEDFCKQCVKVGIDGLIIPDLPLKDYVEHYKTIADHYNIRFTMLITPETSNERIHLIDEHTNGFIYMVSSASTTGAQNSFDEEKQKYFHRINAMQLQNPRLIGFGISNKATLTAANNNAQGAIIGSRFIQLLGSAPSIPAAVTALLDGLKA